ncbi:DUF5068 domain-containing protein [Rossellomorea marisflavi]|uniref:DUF5068 domain-containing protein n=1 Tax=Rossellomorea marisflavi TaxID=189381 RepID=UPI0035164742
MSKKWMAIASALMAALIIGGCGSDNDKASSDEKPKASEEKKDTEKKKADEDMKKDEDTKKDEKKEEAEETSAESGANEFPDLISYMEKETKAKANVLFEADEPQVQEYDDVSVSLDAYTLVELNGISADHKIPFNDETDGGVILAQYTVKNDSDKDVYYMPSLYMNFTGASKSYNDYRYLLPEDKKLTEMLSPSDDYVLKAGETKTGYYTYPMGKADLEKAMDASTAAIDVQAPHTKKGDLGSTMGDKGRFTVNLSEKGAEKTKADAKFYPDRVTKENMGDKKMLDEKQGIGKTEKLEKVNVTLDGYQITEFTPNSDEAPRFENFKNGIILVTVKYELDNKGSDDLSLSSTRSKLTVNDGSQYTLAENMLLDYGNDDIVKAGEKGELIQIYVLDKEQYDKILKDKGMEAEVGPLANTEYADVSEGKNVTFKLK